MESWLLELLWTSQILTGSKFKNILFCCTYLGYFCIRDQTNRLIWNTINNSLKSGIKLSSILWINFVSYLLRLSHKTDTNLKFIFIDSEVQSWFVTEASNLGHGCPTKREGVSPSLYIKWWTIIGCIWDVKKSLPFPSIWFCIGELGTLDCLEVTLFPSAKIFQIIKYKF